MVAAALVLMTAGVASAQDVAPPPELPAADAGAGAGEGGFAATLGADVTFGQLAEDWFLNVLLRFEFSISKLKVGIQGPLRLRVIDEDPQNDSVIREEDWDEVSDYFKIIRFVQWSEPDDVFYARVGEFSGATLGHGTLMRNYLNVIDIDHFQLGIDTKVNTVWGGGEFVLDNIAGPNVVGLRGFVRPWAFVDPESFFTGWSVGTTYLGDFAAPHAIHVDEATGQPRVDDDNNLRYSTAVTSLWGIDTDFTVLDESWVQITPYTDFNVLAGDRTGVGYHLGVDVIFLLPANSGVDVKLEYRYLGAHYSPQYVDSLYEVQRLVYPSPAAYGPDVVPPTKRQAIAAADEGAHGYVGELGASILGLARIVGSLSGSQRPRDNNLTLQALLPTFEWLQLGAIYTKSGFNGFVDAFDLDGAFFQAYARFQTPWFVSVIAQFSRRWQLVTADGDPDYGTYQTVDEWGVGFGFSFGF